MNKEIIRLINAFQRLKKREGFYKALKVSLIYIFNTKSLQQDHKYQLPNPPADLFHPSEILRLTKAFIKKTNDENLYCAFKISFWYIFNREKLTLQTSKSEFFYQNRDIYLKPLISILIVSYNSQKDLSELFESINQQSYKNLEIVLVENGNSESEKYLKKLNFHYKYISSNNIGFASANNLAFENSCGDFVCLVNPDTVLEKNVIELLLFSLLTNNKVAVSIPKIVFYEKFIDLAVYSDKNFSLDLNKLINSLNYKKFFIRHGNKIIEKNKQKVISKDEHLVISIPVDGSEAILEFTKSQKNQFFYQNIYGQITNNKKILKTEINSGYYKINLNCDKDLIWWPKAIINNAGSGLKNGNPYDRGFAEYDNDLFNQDEYVRALCGCVAMISPKVFAKRKIFIDEFFAYYEDSELSNWITNQGFLISYNHSAIVKHKHSVSTEEGSPLWNTFVSRSKRMYDSLVFNKFEQDLLVKDYKLLPKNLVKILEKYDESFQKNNHEILFKKKRPSVGIYNSFWNTMGGGEKHALSIAKFLSSNYDIYLLSETDFDSNKLKDYFSIDFKFRKYIRTNINSETTTYFDLFVNSTFQSRLISNCPRSLYLVSFPHKFSNSKFLKSYLFIYNSIFTKRWANKYWGKHKNITLYPITEIKPFLKKIKVENHKLENQKRNIISIGRFSKNGHDKKQDFILKAFNKAQKISKSEFNLFIVGSVDTNSREDLNHFNQLNKIKNKNTYIFPNLDFKDLLELLSISKFYIHATGVDKNLKRDPHLFEHFGISVIEAMLYGNYPIVFNEGGPSDIVNLTNTGETFKDFDSLVSILVRIFNNFDEDKYCVQNDILKPFLETNTKSLKYLEEFIKKN